MNAPPPTSPPHAVADERGFLRRLFSTARRNRRSPWVPRGVGLLICLAVFGGISLARSRGWLQFLELRAYDLLVALQPKDTSNSDKFIVVGMSDADIDRIGYPMADAVMADIVQKALDGGARAVGIDIYRDKPAGEGRAELLKVFQDRRVVVCLKYGERGVLVGPPPEVKAAQVGVIDLPKDDDGPVRRALMFFKDPAGKSYQAMGLRLATRYLRAEDAALKLEPVPGAPDSWFRLGQVDYRPLEPNDGAYVSADTGATQILFDFRGPERFLPVSVRDVLSDDYPIERFAGKVVILGMTADSVKDYVSTSLVTDQFGPEVHATLAEQLIRGALKGHRPPRAWPEGMEYGWTLAWTLLGGLLGLVVRRPVQFIAMLAVMVAALLAVVYGAFVGGGLWLPSVPPFIGCVAAAGFVIQYMAHHQRSERRVLNELFKRMVSDDVAETLWERRDELLDEGRLAAREVQATVLFTDLQGFTSISEAMDKSCLMAWLNRYMTEMSDVVERKGGFVNKYIGDAVMAVFGPPLERTAAQSRQDAVAAVECALAMRESLAARTEEWTRECLQGVRKKLLDTGRIQDNHDPTLWRPELRMRVGIYTGPVVAGSLGSARRLEYTVIGDTVNTAARLESFDKSLMGPDIAAGGCRILIGQSTLDCVDGKYRTREVGSIMLKGKHAVVTIHGVVGRADAPPANGVPGAAAAVPPPTGQSTLTATAH